MITDFSKEQFVVNWRDPDTIRRMLNDVPLDWHELFANDGPIDLEIGIGAGSFLTPYCAGHPGRNMVGIEIESFYAKKAARRLWTDGLTNGRVLIGDAKLLLWKLFPEKGINDAFINYPDPWFKKRRLKRRVINSETLKMLAVKMTGVLTMATDDEEYKDWILKCAQDSGCFEPVFSGGFATELPGYYQTKYEKKWKTQGKTCYYLKFRKSAEPSPDVNIYVATQNLAFPLRKMAEHQASELELV